MDIEYTFWQMFYLCVSPARVYVSFLHFARTVKLNCVVHSYRTTSWHKRTLFDYFFISPLLFLRDFWHFVSETKNQWARDDPAFVAILIFFMAVASLSYAIAFHAENPLNMIRLIFWAIFVDFLLVGVLVATLGWFVAYISLHTADQ